jgi:hypothetical protein
MATATATYSDSSPTAAAATVSKPTAAAATVSKPKPNPAAAIFDPLLEPMRSTEPVLASQARLCLRSHMQKTNLRSSSMQGTGPSDAKGLAT